MDSEFNHSSHYHKYFKDYYEEKVPRSKGKGHKIVRTYIGPIVSETCSDRTWYLHKLYYVLSSLATLLLCLFFGFIDTDFNRTWYTVLPSVCAFLASLIQFFICVDFASKRRKMTEFDYESGPKRVQLCSLIVMILLVLNVIIFIFYSIFQKEWNLNNLKGLILLTIGTILTALIYIIERRSKYEFADNPAKPIGDGVIIE